MSILLFIVFHIYYLQAYQWSHLFIHFWGFELLIIPQVTNLLVLNFQQSHLFLNAFLIFFEYQLLFNWVFFYFNSYSHSILLSFNTIDCIGKLDLNYSTLNIGFIKNIVFSFVPMITLVNIFYFKLSQSSKIQMKHDCSFE